MDDSFDKVADLYKIPFETAHEFRQRYLIQALAKYRSA